MGHNNIIELNGKQYDAITGAVVGESRIKATPESRAHMKHQGRVIDGFVRQKHAPATLNLAQPSKPKAASTSAKTAVNHLDVRRSDAKPAKAHQPERSQTLMRHIVKKPDMKMKPAIKTTGPTEMMPKPESSLTKQLEKKVSVAQVNPMRLARAHHVAKSQHIHRFVPERRTAAHTLAAHAAATRPLAQSVSIRPNAQHPAVRATAVSVNGVNAHAPIKSRSIALEQAAKNIVARKKASDMFEDALVNANSHEQPTYKAQGKRAQHHRRWASALAAVGAFLVLAGFIAYLNMPKIELRVASIHAGFQAELPGYKPTGYALDGGVKASNGKVQLTYRSGASSYTVTQSASDWNSQTLLDQNTEQRGAPTQTIQSEGRIIYIYNNSASWVNSGVRYDVTGNANLNPDDLVSLATSM